MKLPNDLKDYYGRPDIFALMTEEEAGIFFAILVIAAIVLDYLGVLG